MSTARLNQLIEEFTVDLHAAKGRGQQTVANYRHYLRRFFTTTKITAVEGITAGAVDQFRRTLTERRHGRLEASTVNYHCTALRSFLKFLQRRGVPALDPQNVVLHTLPQRSVMTVETPGINRLLNFPLKRDGRTVLQLRDRAILELLCSTGLRVGEATRLRRDNFTAGGSELAVAGRAGKLRIVPLTQQARYWITQYLQARNDPSPQLFVRHDPAAKRNGNKVVAKPSTTSGGLTPRSIQRLMKKYGPLAGLGHKLQPRMLRHTVAANLLAAGNDLETVRERLGHTTVASTKIYLRQKR